MRMWACTCEHAYVDTSNMCGYIQHVWTHHPTCVFTSNMCGHIQQIFMWRVPPLPLLALHFKTSLSWDLERSGSARLAGQQAKRIHLSLLPQPWGDRHNLAALLLRGWHSGLYASVCVCVHKCVLVHLHACTCGGSKLASDVFLKSLSTSVGIWSHTHIPYAHTHAHTCARTHMQTQTYNLKKNKAYQNQQRLCLLCNNQWATYLQASTRVLI